MMLTSGYARVLRTTGVTGFPYVRAAVGGTIGTDETQVRRRVDARSRADTVAFLKRLDTTTR